MKWFETTRNFLKKVFEDDDCVGLASEMAYSVTLSLFPALILFVSFLSLIQSPEAISTLSDLIGQILPKEIYNPIDKTLEKIVAERQGGIFTLSIFITLFSTAGIFTTVMKAMERIYGVKTDYSFLKRQQIAIELVLLVSVALTVVFSLLLFGVEIEQVLYYKYKMKWLKNFVQYARLPIAFIVIVVSTLIVYKFSLRIRHKLENLLPGAMLMAFLWILLTIWFGDFIKNAQFTRAYDVLAKLIAMLLWMWTNSLIFLLGAELNWFLYKGRYTLAQKDAHLKLTSKKSEPLPNAK
ncbi:MAG: YihY/virulence factor BrkB family protein [Chlorobiales bacterium]